MYHFTTSIAQRIFILCLLLLSFACNASTDREIKKDYPLVKLSQHIYIIYAALGEPTPENQGFRANAVFVVGKDGVVVIDPGTSVYVGRMILKKIRSVTKKPVIAVFNSHAHGDHWLGNQAFKELNPKIAIYAHAKMKELAENGEGERWIKLFNNATDNATEGTVAVVPNKIVKDGDVIKLVGLTFKVHHTGAAHSDNDIMLQIPEDDAIYTGDIVRDGLVGISNSSFKGNIIAIDRALHSGAKLFIPGHGKANDKRIAQAYRDFMVTLRDVVAQNYQDGLSDFEIKPKVVKALAKYQQWTSFKDNIGRLVSLAYLEVEAEEMK